MWNVENKQLLELEFEYLIMVRIYLLSLYVECLNVGKSTVDT